MFDWCLLLLSNHCVSPPAQVIMQNHLLNWGEPEHILSSPVTGCFPGATTTCCTPRAAVGPLCFTFLSFMFGRGKGFSRGEQKTANISDWVLS